MHYVPESAREFLPENSGEAGASATGEDPVASGFHYRSAPIYLLTAVVGLLLGADLLIGLIDDESWRQFQTIRGFRLALIAAVLGGSRILYQTLERLFEGTFGADLALTIAALAAIVLGEQTTAALVVFIALCGESLEGYTVDLARRAIRRIFDLRPTIAHVVRDGRESDIAVAELVSGDAVTIRPGERIPVDGRVTVGVSTVDQSALTGESLPADKTIGDEVFTGTLNQHGSLSVLAEKVGEETTLAQVVRLVAEAAKHKAPLERTADRMARLFLPAVLGIAVLTLIGWRLYAGEWTPGFRPMLGVLVVACPCPLILATPTAVMAAMAWLARTGVVVKGSIALERLATVDTFAFDKTGTLTAGALTLGDVFPFVEIDADELLRTAAIAERRSEHLLARLIVRESEHRGAVVPSVQSFRSLPGAGVVADVPRTILGPWAKRRVPPPNPLPNAAETFAADVGGTCRVLVGNRRLLESEGVPLPREWGERLTLLDDSGQMALIVALEETVLGVIGVRDRIRDASAGVLAELRREGIPSFALLTGDRESSAQAVAGSLGIGDEVHAEMLPQDKSEWIAAQTKAGRKVAMVGDGVNDAPALATATVGLALGGVGSDIAADAGDLVLMGDPLRPLPGLLRLSREMVANIRQSIFVFAFGMNFLGMALCSLGFLSPVGGAVFHEFASLAVMINAMRLLWFERWDQTALGRAAKRLGTVAESLSNALSPSRLTFQFLSHFTQLVRFAVAGVALYWFTTGIVRISADEEALVTRFGRYHTKLLPGLHWRWPAPFERVTRERVDKIRSVQIGFRTDSRQRNRGGESPRTIEWTSVHKNSGYRSVPVESIVLTGNEVPVELAAEVDYRISDLYEYVYGDNRPAETIRAVSESVIRDVAARSSLNAMMTLGRERFRSLCQSEIRKRLQAYRIGIEVTQLQLLEIHPPKEVVPAYRDVADALEEKEQSINDARAYYAATVMSAAGEHGMRFLRETDVIHGIAGCQAHALLDDLRWDAVWKELSHSVRVRGKTVRPVLSGEAVAILNTAEQTANRLLREAEAARDRFISLLRVYRDQKTHQLTRRELYWQTIGETLLSRPLTIIDPKVAGRKHLLLISPDELNGLNRLPALRSSFPQESTQPPPPPRRK